jgi:hypothetical protein
MQFYKSRLLKQKKNTSKWKKFKNPIKKIYIFCRETFISENIL